MGAFELLVAALVLYRHIMYTYSRKPLACVPRSRVTTVCARVRICGRRVSLSLSLSLSLSFAASNT